MPKYSKIIWQRTYYFYSISKMIQYFEDLETFSFRLSPLSVLHYVSTVYQYTKLGEGRVRGSRYNARTGNNVSICQWGAKRPNSHKKKKKNQGTLQTSSFECSTVQCTGIYSYTCRPPCCEYSIYSVPVASEPLSSLSPCRPPAVNVLYIYIYLLQVSIYPCCPHVDLQL